MTEPEWTDVVTTRKRDMSRVVISSIVNATRPVTRRVLKSFLIILICEKKTSTARNRSAQYDDDKDFKGQGGGRIRGRGSDRCASGKLKNVIFRGKRNKSLI